MASTLLFLPLALAAGALLTVQASANLQLSKQTGSPFVASTLQLAVGTGVLVAIAAAAGVITGQVVASVALHVFGLLGVVARPLSSWDIVGALTVIGGAVMIVRAQEARSGPADTPRRALRRLRWVVLALVGGAVSPIQGAVNALLRGDLQSPVAAALLSCAVATAAMAILLVPVITAIPAIGAAVVVGLTVAGQQLASVLFDRYGLMRLPQRPVTLPRLAGVALLLAGVASIQVV